MYGLKDLKPSIEVTDNNVKCPVNGCSEKVERQRNSFKKEEKFKCLEHNIYISSSTFEYEEEEENILWFEEDKELFNKIKKVKRESRISRDNSEDALTWNVFRFLERQNLLPNFISSILDEKEVKKVELILWSYHQKKESSWSCLNKAREEFGETKSKGSEPDIIILTEKTLYFIEAKLTSSNKTPPPKSDKRKKYETGGNEWFKEVFKSDYKKISYDEKFYELMRFWLLGSWIAKELGLNFKLFSLVKKSKDKDIECKFGKHIIETSERQFSRFTWEEIYDFIKNQPDNAEKSRMIEYFENKTIGYSNGKLKKAFEL